MFFKLLNEDGMWKELLRNKYMKDKTLGSPIKKTNRLPFLEESDEYQRFFYGVWLV